MTSASSAAEEVQRLNARFRTMAADWAALHTQSTVRKHQYWVQAFDRISSQQQVLVAAGQWLSGSSDMMRLLGVNDLELSHSRMVAWLLTPTARHGLGDRILTALLDAGWSDRRPMTTSRAVIRLEVTQSATRADIVAYMPEGTLVIENKVWASESTFQCEYLFEEWAGTSADVRFLLLTRQGQRPQSTKSKAAADEWRSLAYSSFATLLADAMERTPGESRPGRGIAEQYLATLEAMSLSGAPFHINIGGGPVHG